MEGSALISTDGLQQGLDFLWLILAAALVFLMQAGFTLLEAGFTRAKHSINVAMKNVADIMITMILFSAIGFPLMFGPTENGWFGWGGFFYDGMGDDPWHWAFLLFQIVFAGTAATIVSGAIAERARFLTYLLGTAIVTVLIYPVSGHWAWGGLFRADQQGWLAEMGFIDFAGSTVVHSVGGWVAFAAAIVIGPRIGKYGEDGRPNRFPASNLILAAMGVFILWFGWIGFNAGSLGKVDTDIALISLNTCLAAAAGGFAAMFVSWLADRLPRPEYMLNGIIAGLVSITAGCHMVSPAGSLAVGAIGGVVVVVAMRLIENVLKVDDVVGAVAVHGVCGVWGTLAVALFGDSAYLAAESRLEQLGVQALGAGAVFLWSFGLGLAVYYLLSKTVKLRVSRDDEIMGLNVSEHGARTSLLDTVRAMNEIAAERIDLTRKLEIEPGDDTAELNESFNYLLDKINVLVRQVKGQTLFVHSNSNRMIELSGHLHENSAEQHESGRQAYDYFREVRERMDRELAEDQETIAAMESSARMMAGISADMRAMFAQMSELAAHVGELERQLDAAQRTAADLIGAMADISAASDESKQITDTIAEISRRIGLLSLNASIEAAKAGQLGAGFAVVAQEIKQLSAQSNLSSEQINQILNHTRQLILGGRESTDKFRQSFAYLTDEISRIPDKIRQAAAEIETMDQAMREVMDNVEHFQARTASMRENRRRQHRELELLMERMERVLGRIRENHAYADMVNAKVGELKDQSDSLDRIVQMFKTGQESVH
jgi:Amt family ammonium transporter